MKEHPISDAAAQGHLNIVEHLLDLGVDINYRDADGLTPLALAAREGHFALTRALINQGAKQLLHDTIGQYPLCSGGIKGFITILKITSLRNYVNILTAKQALT
ncbi:hypothetical protein PENSOL_c003G09320 [Penicillium solitum]|uniref:Uncharacterized protein n=1 Tax=Penicillium solitum TaxID=60172 RepID=A0A1V6RJT3_9EURO|nr:uncharacterized protein PENSOL_c003G09320 [Penicillium solitum]OQE01800.1 hypothetical protein PENSOL_c003G09320 [Penicillium solitum]